MLFYQIGGFESIYAKVSSNKFTDVKCHDYIRNVSDNTWQVFNKKLWQKSYYDHIIRNDKDMLRIQEYIQNNPLKWHLDRENPTNVPYNSKI